MLEAGTRVEYTGEYFCFNKRKVGEHGTVVFSYRSNGDDFEWCSMVVWDNSKFRNKGVCKACHKIAERSADCGDPVHYAQGVFSKNLAVIGEETASWVL